MEKSRLLELGQTDGLGWFSQTGTVGRTDGLGIVWSNGPSPATDVTTWRSEPGAEGVVGDNSGVESSVSMRLLETPALEQAGREGAM